MSTISVVETVAERVEQELARVRAARPFLASRISRAEGIIVTHLIPNPVVHFWHE